MKPNEPRWEDRQFLHGENFQIIVASCIRKVFSWPSCHNICQEGDGVSSRDGREIKNRYIVLPYIKKNI